MKLAFCILATALLTAFTLRPDLVDRWDKVGVVGVDSGQVLLIDPAYIEGEWIRKGAGTNWKVEFWGRDEDAVEVKFGGSPIKCDDKAAAEALIAKIQSLCDSKGLTCLTSLNSGSSYDRCCELTTTSHGFGQLDYRAGHAGLGVASTTGYGDGTFPVFARTNAEGRVEELRILFNADGAEANRLREVIQRQRKRK